MRQLDYRLLGPLEVAVDGAIVHLGRPQQRAVLAILLLQAGKAVSTDQLIDQLWPEKQPGKPQTAIQGYISALRKQLGATTITTSRGGYTLLAEPHQIDTRRFEDLLRQGEEARRAQHEGRARELLGTGLALWRGQALADFSYESWAQPEIQRLEDLRLVALEGQIAARLALGEHRALIGELEALVEAHPLRERPRGQLMLALYRSGRQAEALTVYQQAREQLRAELGVNPSQELQALYKQILNQDEGLGIEPVAARPSTNLPVPPNAFIGRNKELQQLAKLLGREDIHLVTLTGPGGIGKTRLALQAAAEVIERFENGAFWVPLAPVRDPVLVIPAVAQALGVREEAGEPIGGTLARYSHGKRLLLVLDNVEHVIEAAASIAELLAAAPAVRVLATSREPLRIRGEQVYDVPPLAVPATDREAVVADAVELFASRASAADSSFALTAENTGAISQIVTRLDGLPLAIELAAARIRVLSPQGLLERLDNRLRLLTGGGRDAEDRQQTLRATIQWSYDLLSEAEQALFARLGVFVGGCRLGDAEALCAECGLGLDVFDGVASLVEKSLLRRRTDPDGQQRYWMLETIREYAAEVLDSGARAAVRAWHARHFLALAEAADTAARSGDQAAYARFDAETPNLRAALDWADENGDRGLAVRLATALSGYWYTRGQIGEGLRRLEHVVNADPHPPARALLALYLLRHMAAWSAQIILRDVEALLPLLEQAGDDHGLAQAWNLIGRSKASGLGEIAAGEEAWQRALAYAERSGFAAERAESMGWLMVMAVFGPLPTSEGISRCEAFKARAADDEIVQAFALVELGVLCAMRGEAERARRLLTEGRASFAAHGLNVWAANTAQEGFYVEMLGGDPAAANALLRESCHVLEEMGEQGFLSTVAAFRAHALYALDAYDEALQLSRQSEQLAAHDDVISQVLWRTARAKIQARRGEFDAAETLAKEAVAIAEPSEMLNVHGDALRDLAEVLRLSGKRDAAAAALDEAAQRYDAKQNLAALSQLRAIRPSFAEE